MKQGLHIKYVPIADLTPYAGNARSHSRQQVRQIVRSIQAFGFINPVLVDEKGQLVAGHGRLLAARELGITTIPAVRIDHLTDDEKRAYLLADNKIAENAGWDQSLLRIELEYLARVDIELDVELSGFSTPEIDIALGALEDVPKEPPIPSLPEEESLTVQSGDLWRLGPHRLICGDCRDLATMDRLMGGRSARMVFTDPPYNVPIEGHARGNGKIHHDHFEMAAGEMSAEDFTRFLTKSLAQLARVSREGALSYVCMDWRHMGELLAAGREVYADLSNLCVWNKSSGGMGSFYRSKHELVFVFRKGGAAHVNNVELGRHGRNRTNVWDYPGVNAFGEGRDESLAMHPTVKPVRMIADAVLDASRRAEIVLDGFAGSGSTLLAAEQTGRVFRGVEIDPRYVDVMLRRWRDASGDEPVHDETGMTYEQSVLTRTGTSNTREA